MAKTENWTADNIPALNGKLAVITGANSGIGFEAAKEIARQGGHVVLAVRNIDKGNVAMNVIRRTYPNAKVDLMKLNLASLKSVEEFADAFLSRWDSLPLLINNAGVMAVAHQYTENGFEMQFGTNHLGHFALTGRLLPALLKADGARVVSVSSAAHNMGQIHFDNLDGKRGYHRWRFYGQSKLANLLFAYELERRFEAAKIDAISVACHPGFAATNLMNAGFGAGLGKVLQPVANLFAQSAAMGALPTLYAATEPSVAGGTYIGPLKGMRGYPGVVQSNDRSHDRVVANRLWELSEDVTGVRYVFG